MTGVLANRSVSTHPRTSHSRAYVLISDDSKGCSLTLFVPANVQDTVTWTDDLKKEIAKEIDPCVDIRGTDEHRTHSEIVGKIQSVVQYDIKLSNTIICKLDPSMFAYGSNTVAFAQYVSSRWFPQSRIPNDPVAFGNVLLHRAIYLYRLLKSKQIKLPKMDRFLGRL